jgi:hypothetical protein
MSVLGDIVQRCIAAVEVPGYSIKVHTAVEHGVPLVLADRDTTLMAAREFLTIKIKAAIGTRGRKAERHQAEYVQAGRAGRDGAPPALVSVPRQMDLFDDPFDLREGYVLEGGTVEMKRTRYVTQREFAGLIRLRRKSWTADGKHLDRLAKVYDTLRPIWDIDPEMTYEEACAIYVRQYGQPDLPPDDGDEG